MRCRVPPGPAISEPHRGATKVCPRVPYTKFSSKGPLGKRKLGRLLMAPSANAQVCALQTAPLGRRCPAMSSAAPDCCHLTAALTAVRT